VGYRPEKDKVVIDAEQYTGPEVIEYICTYCHCSVVKISDAGGNNNELFCTRCSIPFAMDDDTVRHKQQLSVPQETEPDISSVGVDIDVSIRHT